MTSEKNFPHVPLNTMKHLANNSETCTAGNEQCCGIAQGKLDSINIDFQNGERGGTDFICFLFIYFVYCLFNEAVITSDNIALNDKMASE